MLALLFLPHSCNKTTCIFIGGGAEDEKMIAICLLTTMPFSTLVGCDVKVVMLYKSLKIKKSTYKRFYL